MRAFLSSALFLTASLLAAGTAHGQQAPSPPPAPATLSEDSVRVMSGLVASSVRQLRAIYFEPNDARTVELIDKALVDIPVLNQRLSHYTASLPREQQQQLAQRLRQQPWQVELNTLLRSPQYQGFDARAAKTPELKAATDRLRASGLLGTAKPTVAKAPAPAPMGTISLPKTPPATAAKPATRPAASASLVPAAPAPKAPAAAPAPAATGRHHTVQKGETLFSIARQYNTTPSQLQQWNDKTESSVKIGEVLVVEAGK